jgi:hypothetical protein
VGLFGRKPDPDRERAKAIAKRGVSTRAQIDAVRATGERRGAVGRELELTLSFTTREGAPVRAVVKQFFNDITATGLDAGEVAEIVYDREEPQTIVVMGSARYRMVDGALVEVVDPKRSDSSRGVTG